MLPIRKSRIKRDAEKKMNDKNKKIDETLRELLIGIVVCGILVEVGIICCIKDKIYASIGLWFGVILALLSAFHMWRSLNIGLEL